MKEVNSDAGMNSKCFAMMIYYDLHLLSALHCLILANFNIYRWITSEHYKSFDIVVRLYTDSLRRDHIVDAIMLHAHFYQFNVKYIVLMRLAEPVHLREGNMILSIIYNY